MLNKDITLHTNIFFLCDKNWLWLVGLVKGSVDIVEYPIQYGVKYNIIHFSVCGFVFAIVE